MVVKSETTNTGSVISGICTATSFSGSGEGLTHTTQLFIAPAQLMVLASKMWTGALSVSNSGKNYQ